MQSTTTRGDRRVLGRRRRAALVLAGFGVSLLGISGAGSTVLRAQTQPSHSSTVDAGSAVRPTTGRLRRVSDLTFEVLFDAHKTYTYEVQQVRRVRQDDPARVSMYAGVHEQLLHRGDSEPGGEAFRLSFVAPEIGLFDQAELDLRRAQYVSSAGFLYANHSFRVRDAALAALNYQLVVLGPAQRLARPVARALVYPREESPSAWLIDVDMESGLVLYSGEYDLKTQILRSELRVTSLKLGRDAAIPVQPGWEYRSLHTTRHFEGPAQLRQALQNDPTLRSLRFSLTDVSNDFLPMGYVSVDIRVTEDPYNQDRKLIHAFSDGIDMTFVAQSVGLDPFAVLEQNLGPANGQQIGKFADWNVMQFVFHDRGSNFMVAGRSSAGSLDETALRLFQAARARR